MSLFIDNSYRLEVAGLKDDDGELVAGATVTATLFLGDRETEVGGVTWPVTLADEGGGTYGALLDAAVEIEADKTYAVRFVAEKGGVKATWWSYRTAKLREFRA